VGDRADGRGPVVREMRGRRPAREDATDARAGWAGRVISACGEGAVGGLAGLEAKRAAGSAGPKIRKKEISELKLDF
jgi:hypothetical protein